MRNLIALEELSPNAIKLEIWENNMPKEVPPTSTFSSEASRETDRLLAEAVKNLVEVARSRGVTQISVRTAVWHADGFLTDYNDTFEL